LKAASYEVEIDVEEQMRAIGRQDIVISYDKTFNFIQNQMESLDLYHFMFVYVYSSQY